MQLPGPTNVPDAVLQAIARPTLDHRGAAFAALARSVLADLPGVFGTSGPVALYPGSGTGGWEAALTNTLSPGNRVLICETGFFAAGWAALAAKLGLDVSVLRSDWRGPADPEAVREALEEDEGHRIRAVLVVHNETSTGATSDLPAVRGALDEAGHPALLLVDAVSSLAAIPVDQDACRADVVVAASQKGLMLPPGLTMLGLSAKAIAAKGGATLPCAYWDWQPVVAAAQTGSFPYTPASNLVVGLRAALDRLLAEGLDAVYRRHRRHGAAFRAAVQHWGLGFLCRDPAARSDSVTAIALPDAVSDEVIRARLLADHNVIVGGGLGRLRGRCLRVGHLGDLDDLMVLSTVAALEMALPACGVTVTSGGVDAAMAALGADHH